MFVHVRDVPVRRYRGLDPDLDPVRTFEAVTVGVEPTRDHHTVAVYEVDAARDTRHALACVIAWLEQEQPAPRRRSRRPPPLATC